jgi:putative hydrolase of HD superfamily
VEDPRNTLVLPKPALNLDDMEADSDLNGIIDFLRDAERLKDAVRSGYTTGGRQESVADHSWRLCLMALVLHHRFEGFDLGRLIAICVVHDIGEALSGDIPAPQQTAAGKTADERRDLLTLIQPLPGEVRQLVTGLWDEYEAASTPEARLAKAFDKLETILQHTQGANPPDFDYRFNLDYGRRYTAGDATLEAIRALLDAATEARANQAR